MELRTVIQMALDTSERFADLGPQISGHVAREYRARWGLDRVIDEFDGGDDFWYLFDSTPSGRTEPDEPAPRVLATWGISKPNTGRGDRRTLRRFPLPPMIHRRFDRGHLIAMSLGAGDYVNLVPQDPALNRGWSNPGRRWRALERYLARHPGTFIFVAVWYSDLTDVPERFDYAIVTTTWELRIESFSNGPTGR